MTSVEARWATRDASWYQHPGKAAVFHKVSEDGISSTCGVRLLDVARTVGEDDIEDYVKCKRCLKAGKP